MTQPISPEMVYELTGVAAPSLSPDGRQLVYARSKVDLDSMETRSQIMVMTLDDKVSTPLIPGTKDSSPKYSPDGRLIAFLRAGDKNRRQLWVMDSSGDSPRQLTLIPDSISEFSWSPDSRTLAFVSDVNPDRLPDGHDEKKDPQVKVVTRVRYRADTVGWRGDAFRHIFLVDIDTDGEGEGVRQITRGDGEDSSPQWSPDGSRIAFMSDRGDNRDFVNDSQIYVVSPDGSGLWGISPELNSVAGFAWSPDSSRIAVIASDDPEAPAGRHGLIYIMEHGHAPRPVTNDSVMPATGYAPTILPPEMRWTDDDAILFIGDERGESYLYKVSAISGDIRRVFGGGLQLNDVAFDADATKAVVLAVPTTSSGDFHLVDIADASQSQLTEVNKSYFAEHPAAGFDKFTITRAGSDIECRAFFPPGFDPSRKYPMVLDIHGGPHGVFSDSFNNIQQVLATNGYIVLAVNPRGSSTYGLDFLKSVLGDWGGEDYLDIMAGVDAMSSRPYVDPERLGITGYSYGGFMSSWIIGHDTRFKAAAVGAPCINLSSMYGTSDIGIRFGETQWGGIRKDAVDKFLAHSPLTYAPDVETPVLLLHGEADVRCPIEQSEQYFVTLKRLGKQVEFVRFPDCSHMFLRGGHPKMRVEYLKRVLDWFNKHIGASSRASPAAEAVPADN
jgi:dipeptidyl aminopeptidase/acylaminoacyl peptidase